MSEIALIEEQLAVIDAAVAQVRELHGDSDFLLAGSMVSLLAKRIDLLLKAERLVAGTDQSRLFDGPLRQAIDAEQAARSLFAALTRSMAEQQAATFH